MNPIKSALFAITLAPWLIALFVMGCATSSNPSPSPLSVPSPTITGGITLVTSAGVAAALNYGVTNQVTRIRDAGYLYTGATLTLQLAQGQAVTPAAYQNYLTTYGIKNDSQYAAIASTITSLYSTFVYPKLQSGNAVAINAYLVAFAQGLQNGAASYAPSTVLPTSTTFLPAHLELRPVHGWRNAYNVELVNR